MADNITLNAGTGGSTIKTDDDGTAHWQYCKIAFGADNTQTRVTSTSGLPVELLASTAAIGKLAANSGVDIGDVDITSVVTGTGATNLGKAEDAAHTTGDVGVMALTVRQNTAAATSGTDGDYQPLITDTNGRLHVLDANSATIAGAVSGTEMQVDVVAALPAGTNAIGKLAANSGVDIGDVDVTSVIPGTGATNLGKAIDTAAGATDTGVAALAIRDDALSTLTPVEGDWAAFRCNSTGALWVQETNSATIAGAVSGTEMQVDIVAALPAGTNAIGKLAANSGVDIGDVDITSVIPGTGATNAGKAVDTAAGATDTGSATLAVRDDALSALTPIEGDYVNLRTTSTGALWTQDVNSATIAGAVSGTEMQVDVVAALPAGTNAIGKLAANSGVDIGDVDVTSVIPGTGATNLGKAEDAAHTTGDVGVMALAVRTDDQAALAGTTADYSPLQVNALGALVVSEQANSTTKFAVIDAATSGDNTLVAAVSSKKIRVLSCLLVSAGTVTARFESGAGGTALSGQMNLVANSGFTLPYNPQGWFETAVTTLLNLELSAAISVDGCLSYIEVA